MPAHKGYGSFADAVALWFGGEEPPNQQSQRQKIVIERPTYKKTCEICGVDFEAKAIHAKHCKSCAVDKKRAKSIAYYHKKRGEANGAANNTSHSDNNHTTFEAV